jgi:hypothetical protein
VSQSYRPREALLALVRNNVAFIVIGGIAGGAHGSPQVTFDLDVCYERSRESLERLARALQEMHATLRGAPPDLPFGLDARTLPAGDHFTFSTDFGDLDCLGTPSGTSGYDDLIRNAIEVEVDGVAVKIAGLDDLIRMKRASGRPKDLYALEILGALRDEVDGEPPATQPPPR